ncbi:hypothetical protein TNIN_352521 [Trichonephila inaurata madagascariensis]|uniref:SWIM-type domain-containing protein n=1 Tax=Trichonephila inaurata madagascariensis TaxID=2747483 RepID=A0A8X7C170_9ARAC|nr:hypothetical protein TNIN_352521 [Trichonephila inaurata madagascariensis]
MCGNKSYSVVERLNLQKYTIPQDDTIPQKDMNSQECMKWNAVASMQKCKGQVAAFKVCFFNHHVFKCSVSLQGGFKTNKIPANSVEKYDPVTDQWSYVTPMRASRGDLKVASLGRCIYAMGGNGNMTEQNVAETYDVDKNRLEDGPPMLSSSIGAEVISATCTCPAGGTPAFCKHVFALLHAINDYVTKKLYEAPTQRLDLAPAEIS